MQSSTKANREWRDKQRLLGRIPKLIWLHPDDWPEVRTVVNRVKRRRAKDKQ